MLEREPILEISNLRGFLRIQIFQTYASVGFFIHSACVTPLDPTKEEETLKY